ncbi:MULTISPECIES: hypothetical protein [Nostocaceae]|nr:MULTISPECIES: hypothetical protein [Nostocaceae]
MKKITNIGNTKKVEAIAAANLRKFIQGLSILFTIPFLILYLNE